MKNTDNTSKIQRLLKIIKSLEQASYSSRQLAEQLGLMAHGEQDMKKIRTAQRTIQRDFIELRKYKFDIQNDPRNPGKKTIPAPGKNGLDPLEALALYAATRMLYHHAPNRTYRAALSRLTQFIPQRVREIVKGSIAEIEQRSREDKALEKAAVAWFKGQPLQFKYKAAESKSGEWRENTLEVYFIEVHKSNLGVYVIGKEISYHNKIRTFKASRMKDPTVIETTEPYEIPNDFKPLEYLSGALGVVGQSDGKLIRIQLRFAKEVRSRVLENDIFNLQITREMEDGTLEAQINVGVDKSGLPREALAWINSWGPRIEVTGPIEVRNRWLEDARELIRRYDT